MQNQLDNWSNSKQARSLAASGRGVAGLVSAVALAVLGAALAMPPPLSGRLHPAHVPAAIALLALVAVAACMRYPRLSSGESDPACLSAAPASRRSILCAVGAIFILALGTRSLGLLPAVFAAGAVGALGVRGVGMLRAAAIGAGLAAVAALLIVAILRKPLPLLPGRW